MPQPPHTLQPSHTARAPRLRRRQRACAAGAQQQSWDSWLASTAASSVCGTSTSCHLLHGLSSCQHALHPAKHTCVGATGVDVASQMNSDTTTFEYHFNTRHTSSWWQNTKWPIRAKLSQEGCKRSPCLCLRDAFFGRYVVHTLGYMS